MTQPTEVQIRNFTELVTGWSIDQLLSYFARCWASDTYGERDVEVSIVRAEIKSRCAK